MESAIRALMLSDADFVSHCADTARKGMNPYFPLSKDKNKTLGSLHFIRQPIQENEKFEFKLAVFDQKLTYCHILFVTEELCECTR